MTGIFARRPVSGRPRCARCHRPFTPRKEGDRYGKTCARKIAANQTLELGPLRALPAVIV